MFLKRRSSNWNKADTVCSSWKFLGMAGLDRLAILDAVWKKEMGRLGEHCALLGVERGFILVKPSSSAAASELALRSSVLVKGLNKYFKRPWIKAIKTANSI
ncbi:MAG: DciA family protein [Elusimicrobiales bacterium]|nr:DciA family protein [Elusimicrobiales bacterium]